jgi:GTP-binding protein Era
LIEKAYRFGFAAVVGKPNVGKSSLVNRLTGKKVSITSRRPQTTRNQILGIVNRPDFQLALVDTPGIHQSRTLLNQRIDQAARISIGRAEITMMVIDARGWRVEDEQVRKIVERSEQPTFVLINKVDVLNSADRLLPLIQECSERGNIAEIIPVSAKTGHNLDRLLQLTQKYLPIGSPMFPLQRDVVTNLNFSVAELVREQIFRLAGAEIPYQSAVTVRSPSAEMAKRPEFHADIWVESAGQKAILVGAGGQRLRNIGLRARKQVERLLGTDVVLTTTVKVRKGWSSDPLQLRNFGYSE